MCWFTNPRLITAVSFTPLSKFTFGQFSSRCCIEKRSGGRKEVEAVSHRDSPSQMSVLTVLLGPPLQMFIFGNHSGHLTSYRLVPNTCLLPIQTARHRGRKASHLWKCVFRESRKYLMTEKNTHICVHIYFVSLLSL